MYKHNLSTILFFFTCILLLTSCKKEIAKHDSMMPLEAKAAPSATVSVFASGFTNPRGLEWAPDGNLYLAEAGSGVTAETGGRISRITPAGAVSTVTTDLPTMNFEGEAAGPMDLTFLNNTLYVLSDGGASLNVSRPAGIYRVNSNGSTTVVADLGAWQRSHPVANPPQDFLADGSWYNVAAVRGDLYALDANHGELVRVSTSGAVSRVADLSATQGHSVPTALDYRGNFYIGNLGLFTPTAPGQEKIIKVSPDGSVQDVATGLSAIVGLVIDQRSWMYVLELGDVPFPFAPGLGKIIAISPSGEQTVLVAASTGFTDLTHPTAMTMGPDGNLYVSNKGFGGAPGSGQVLKVTLH